MKRDLQFGILIAVVTGIAVYTSVKPKSATTPKVDSPAAIAPSSKSSSSDGPIVVSPSIPGLAGKQSTDPNSALTDIVPDGFTPQLEAPRSPAGPKLATAKSDSTKTSIPPKQPPTLEAPKIETAKSSNDSGGPILPGSEELPPPKTVVQQKEKGTDEKKQASKEDKLELPVPGVAKTKDSVKVTETASSNDDDEGVNNGELLYREGRTEKKNAKQSDVAVKSYELKTKEDAKPDASPAIKSQVKSESKNLAKVSESESVTPPRSLAAASRGNGKGPAHPYYQRYLDDGEYFVRPGDTLKQIAFRLYRDESRAADIAKANSNIQENRSLKAGTRLKLPKA